ncbi:MAG TPA: type II toxin-antitoxin system ParD family antitoxin [Lacipirellulaceae bacterium]|jgi:putative addiction module CopG family antidote
MDIQITPEVAQLVHAIYDGGQYGSESEVLMAALRLLHQRQLLRKDLEQGCRELANGQRIDADQVFSGLRQMALALDKC